MWAALGFLTVFPIPRAAHAQLTAASAPWFPWVGLLIGALAGVSFFVFDRILTAPVSAALTVAVWAALSGGLHLDGLADTCDGLSGSASRERRIEIMHDPRAGVFGVVGVALALLVKLAAVTALAGESDVTILPFLLAAAVARWLVLPAARVQAARADGLGAAFAAGLSRRAVLVAAALPALLTVPGGWRALAGSLLAGLLALALVRVAVQRLGGMTGDVHGAIVELAEVAVLLPFGVQAW